jgi:hypothetical protein
VRVTARQKAAALRVLDSIKVIVSDIQTDEPADAAVANDAADGITCVRDELATRVAENMLRKKAFIRPPK